MEDFYKDGAGDTDSIEDKEGKGVDMEMIDTKVEVIDAGKANGVASEAQPV